MSINPNDPVVEMLKGIVTQFEQKLDDLAQETMDGFKVLGEGNMKVFTELFQRVAKLEVRNNELTAQLESLRPKE